MSDPLKHGPFQIVRRLAVGGMGEVLLAESEGDQRVKLGTGLVVVKRTLPKHPNLDHQNRMLREEGRIALRLRHANLVETFALDEVDGIPLLVMEYLAGRSMAQVLGAAKRTKQMVPPDVALKIIHESACGLHFAHTLKEGEKLAGLVHRDVSPANIFVTFDGRVKVIDFGVAKADDSEIKTSTGVLKGKIGYMSPEHTLGEKLDPRSDLWSLGVLLWETLIADRLFASQNPALTLHKINHAEIVSPRVRRTDLSPSVDNLVMRLLTRAKDERVGSGAELVHLIEKIEDVNWREADLSAFLMERFPDEAARGQEEARRAAKASGAPVPQGLVTGTTADHSDDDVATIVANSRDLIELARRVTAETNTLDEDDEARTVQLSAAEVAELTGNLMAAPPAVGAVEEGPGRTVPLFGGGPSDLSTEPSGIGLNPEDQAKTVARTSAELLGTLDDERALHTAPDSLLPTPPAATPSPNLSAEDKATRPARSRSGPSRAAESSGSEVREASGSQRRPKDSGSFAASRSSSGIQRRRRGPTATAVALGTFGLLATAMGLIFGGLQPSREQIVVAWPSPSGAEVISARIDVPTSPEPTYQRKVDLMKPRIVLGKNELARFVEPSDLRERLQSEGVWARADLPHTPRARFAAALPPLFIILGLIALAWAVPGFMLRGSAAWGVRIALMAGALSVGGAGLWGGLLGWPGFSRLDTPSASIAGGDLKLAGPRSRIDSSPKTR